LVFAICQWLSNPFAPRTLAREPDETSSPQATLSAETDGWTLAWSDEFDKDGPPDPSDWDFERGFVRNEELQWYQPDNARCVGGILIIEGRRERRANPEYRADSRSWQTRREFAEYTSASLHTKDLHSWQYGRFEMRARIDTRSGCWPAFWTLGVRGEWPACGEIDIMEFYRGTLFANAAWGTEKRWTPRWDDLKRPIMDFDDAEWSSKFHVWRMDWDEAAIRLYVDGELLNEVDLNHTINGDREGQNPFRQPHYILLSLAIGGTNGGDPSTSEPPLLFEVDYVRVYKGK
jgi:beta-glucanase (GH16 family)